MKEIRTLLERVTATGSLAELRAHSERLMSSGFKLVKTELLLEPLTIKSEVSGYRIFAESDPAQGLGTLNDIHELRRMLFLQHTHSQVSGNSHLYGDDGEMQCALCYIDFKRDSPEQMRHKMILYFARMLSER